MNLLAQDMDYVAGLAVVLVGHLAATPPNVAQGIELQAIAAVIIAAVWLDNLKVERR